MILLHEPKIIFLKARKVAGTSFEIALSQFAGPRDVITPIAPRDEDIRAELGFPGPRNYLENWGQTLYRSRKDFKERLLRGTRHDRFYNHISARKVSRLVGRRIWDTYTKVAIVRNPFDVAVSLYYLYQPNARARMPFGEWCAANEHFFGNNARLYLVDGRPIVDVFIRYEHFDTDVPALEDRFPELSGLARTFASIHAKGGFRPKSMTPEKAFASAPDMIDLVARKNQYEIETFGYELAAG